MNIVEAYIKFRGQLVILVTGISGSGISHLAKNISSDLKINSLSYAKFCKPDYNEKVKLPDGSEITNWDTDDTIDWDKFNAEINQLKSKGVVAYNQSFPVDRLDPNLQVDAQIQIRLSKQNLFARRQKYIQDHPEECKDIANRNQELLIFNRYTFPYYLQTSETNRITKNINANEFVNLPEQEYDDKLADEAFDYLMNIINKWLERYSNETSNQNRQDTGYNEQQIDQNYPVNPNEQNYQVKPNNYVLENPENQSNPNYTKPDYPNNNQNYPNNNQNYPYNYTNNNQNYQYNYPNNNPNNYQNNNITNVTRNSDENQEQITNQT